MDTGLEKTRARIYRLVGVTTSEEFLEGQERLIMAIEDCLRDDFNLVAVGLISLPVVNNETTSQLKYSMVVAKIFVHLLQGRHIEARHNIDPTKSHKFVAINTIKNFFDNHRAISAMAGNNIH